MKKIFTFASILLVFSAVTTRAANFVTKASQGSTANWTAAIWSNPPNATATAPTSGNTYELIFNGTAYGNNTADTRTRNPQVAGTQTFPGDSLTLDANTDIRCKLASGAAVILNFPGVGGNPGLILNGGALNPGDDGVFEFQGKINVLSDSVLAMADNGLGTFKPLRGIRFNAALSGTGSLIVLQGVTSIPCAEVVSANNTYSGTWIVKAGYLKGTGSGSLGSCSILVDPNYAVSSSLVNPSTALSNGPALFEPMYNITTTGTLTIANNGQMTLHQDCSFSSVIINGTALSCGAHPYSELLANFPNNFPAGGSGSITVAGTGPPPAPTNIRAVGGDSQVRLSWTAAPGADSYIVMSSGTSGGPYSPIATVTSTGYTNTGLANGSTVYYVVQGNKSCGGNSANSSEVFALPNPAVAGFTASGGTGRVALAWSGMSSGSADSYNVKRSTTSGGPYTTLATVTELSYTDTAVQNGTTYYYIVDGNLSGGGGVSNPSVEASASVAPGAAPLTASLLGDVTANLSWTLSDPAIGAWLVEQSTDGVNFNQIAALPGSNRVYRVFGLTGGTTYTFQVRATNSGGFGPYSNQASVSTPTFTAIHVNFASGPLASSGTLNAPIPPGYVQDIGKVLGDRDNGFKYGWDRNIEADGRYRQAVNSPDLRYDTFVHMIKATPAAIWNIAIANGTYDVHVVGGDPSNADEVFQYDIEGVVTDTILPNTAQAFSNNWADFKVTCTVTDGQLTIKSGPNSQTTANNNKIDFIDITVPTPVAITAQPQSVTTNETRRATFAVSATGSTPITYQWYMYGPGADPGTAVAINGATSRTYTINSVLIDRDSGNYYVIVSNPLGSLTSDTAQLIINPDQDPPMIVSASSLDGSKIKLQWDESIDPQLSGDPGVYDVSGAFVNNAQVLQDGNGDYTIVILTVSGLASYSFDVGTPGGVFDLSGNAQTGDPIITGSVFALSSGLTDEGILGTASDPLERGSATIQSNRLEVVAGGSDIWNNADGGRYAYGQYTGDFDLKVRVASLSPRDRWSKAGLLVRADLTPGSQDLSAVITPAAATALDGTGATAADYEAGNRPTAAGATVDWGTFRPTNGPPNVDAWLRMRRRGDVFSAYYITNSNWALFATTNQVFPSAVYVGLGTSAHNNGAGQTTTAVYRDYKRIQGAPMITTQPQSQTVTQGSTAIFTVVASGDGAPFSYQWRKGGVNMSGATSSTLTLNNVQPSDAADYSVIVTDIDNATTSLVGTLFVRTPPSINTPPQSQTVACGNSVTFTVAAGGSPPLTYQWRKGTTPINGATDVSYTIPVVHFSDAADYSVIVSNDLGNATSSPATLTVTDTVRPQATCPANIVTACTGAGGATVTFTATATDNCDPNPGISCMPQSGSTFHIGTTTVNCTATDASANQGTCSFTVTVNDTVKPQITCPADMTNSCTGPNGATVTFSATATDNCDPNPVVNCTPASGTVFHQGATTVHCTAEDASGNQTNCSFTVTVEDTTSATVSIVQNGTQVTISYPSTCTTYRLVHKSNLDDPTWDNVSGVQLMGDHYEASYTTTGGSGFFQLQSP